MDAQLECSNWVGSSMGGRLWIHNQFIVYFILNNFLVSVGSMLAGHLDGRNMVHLLKIRPFMRRCSPERMFPSSQWWRCRCYIDTFLLWDSPREFPTSSTAYHSKFIHCSKWSILSDMDITLNGGENFEKSPKTTWHLQNFGVRGSWITHCWTAGDPGDPAHDATCHQLYGQYRSSRFKWVDLSSWPAIAWNCRHLTDASCEKIRVRCRELIHLSITIGEDFLNGLVLFQPGKVGIPEDNIDAML